MEKVIDFSPSGAVSSLHHDEFDLGFLGAQRIHRATDIRFAESTQRWGIYVLREDGYHWTIPSLMGFLWYDDARRFEVTWINECIARGANWRKGDNVAMVVADLLRYAE